MGLRKGNSSEMNNAKILNNSQPSCSSLHTPRYVHMKHTLPVISNISVGASLVQCFSIRQMLYKFYRQKMVGFVMLLLRIHRCWSGPHVLGTKRENSLAWKSFQSNHECQRDVHDEKKRHGKSCTAQQPPVRCIL